MLRPSWVAACSKAVALVSRVPSAKICDAWLWLTACSKFYTTDKSVAWRSARFEKKKETQVGQRNCCSNYIHPVMIVVWNDRWTTNALQQKVDPSKNKPRRREPKEHFCIAIFCNLQERREMLHIHVAHQTRLLVRACVWVAFRNTHNQNTGIRTKIICQVNDTQACGCASTTNVASTDSRNRQPTPLALFNTRLTFWMLKSRKLCSVSKQGEMNCWQLEKHIPIC